MSKCVCGWAIPEALEIEVDMGDELEQSAPTVRFQCPMCQRGIRSTVAKVVGMTVDGAVIPNGNTK